MIEEPHKTQLVASMLEALQCYEGDAELDPDDPGGVIIPYYAHGRMNAHKIDMVSLAETAVSSFIIAGKITNKD